MTIPLGFADAIGYAAACCTTLSFVPQLVKIHKHGGDGLSYSMLSIYLAGVTMWFVYGILLHATAVAVANAATAGLVAAAIGMKTTIRSPALKAVDGKSA